MKVYAKIVVICIFFVSIVFFMSCEGPKKIILNDSNEEIDDVIIVEDDNGNTGNTVDLESDEDSGNTGDDGNTGNTVDLESDEDSGNTGDDGNTGNTGDTGNTEPDEDSGNTGDTGNTGNTGNTGDTGNTTPDEDIVNLCEGVVCVALGQCHKVGECNPTTGVCSNPVKTGSCNDGNACTQTDTCQAGACIGSDSVICSALEQCYEVGECNSSTGVCSNPFRIGSCVDGDAYTINDTCQNGICSGESVSCILDSECDNSDICDGLEICNGNNCQSGTSLNCNDNIRLTIDSCDPLAGCVNTPVECIDNSDCDDFNICNGIETCSGNICQAGATLNCDDSIRLTLDSCDIMTGCINTPVECIDNSDCDDFNICNGLETCNSSNTCESGITLDCNDDIRLTLDSCNSITGCINTTVECLDETDCIEGEFYETPSCTGQNICLYDIVCTANKLTTIVPENILMYVQKDKNLETLEVVMYPIAGKLIKNIANSCHIFYKDIDGNDPFVECKWGSDYDGLYKCKPPFNLIAAENGCSMWPGDHCISQE